MGFDKVNGVGQKIHYRCVSELVRIKGRAVVIISSCQWQVVEWLCVIFVIIFLHFLSLTTQSFNLVDD